MKDNILNNEISERLKTLINQWALSVFQRLEREHPEVLRVLLSEEVQLDQRRKNKTSKRTSEEI